MDQVEYLIGYEGNAFAFTGKIEEDLLSITAVHSIISTLQQAREIGLEAGLRYVYMGNVLGGEDTNSAQHPPKGKSTANSREGGGLR